MCAMTSLTVICKSKNLKRTLPSWWRCRERVRVLVVVSVYVLFHIHSVIPLQQPHFKSSNTLRQSSTIFVLQHNQCVLGTFFICINSLFILDEKCPISTQRKWWRIYCVLRILLNTSNTKRSTRKAKFLFAMPMCTTVIFVR